MLVFSSSRIWSDLHVDHTGGAVLARASPTIRRRRNIRVFLNRNRREWVKQIQQFGDKKSDPIGRFIRFLCDMAVNTFFDHFSLYKTCNESLKSTKQQFIDCYMYRKNGGCVKICRRGLMEVYNILFNIRIIYFISGGKLSIKLYLYIEYSAAASTQLAYWFTAKVTQLAVFRTHNNISISTDLW